MVQHSTYMVLPAAQTALSLADQCLVHHSGRDGAPSHPGLQGFLTDLSSPCCAPFNMVGSPSEQPLPV